MAEEKPQSTAPNFNELELKVLKFWDDNNIFEKSLEQTKNSEPFVFYDGPPFATGLPHYGQYFDDRHQRRFWALPNHEGQVRPPASGVGIATACRLKTLLSKILKISGKKQIEEIGVDRFNEHLPRKRNESLRVSGGKWLSGLPLG